MIGHPTVRLGFFKGHCSQAGSTRQSPHPGTNQSIEVLVYDDSTADSAVPCWLAWPPSVAPRLSSARQRRHGSAYAVGLDGQRRSTRWPPAAHRAAVTAKSRLAVHAQRQSASGFGRDQPTDHGRNSRSAAPTGVRRTCAMPSGRCCTEQSLATPRRGGRRARRQFLIHQHAEPDAGRPSKTLWGRRPLVQSAELEEGLEKAGWPG